MKNKEKIINILKTSVLFLLLLFLPSILLVLIFNKDALNVSDKNYITHLYGYSYNVHELSIDVNIGYLDNGVLYDLADNRLGEYTGEVKELQDLFKTNSFYRYNYVKDDGMYKLISVEWMDRI